MKRVTIEELARMPPREALTRRFDERNLIAYGQYSMFFSGLLGAAITLAFQSSSVIRIAPIAGTLIVTIITAAIAGTMLMPDAMIRRRHFFVRPARAAERYASWWIVAALIAQFIPSLFVIHDRRWAIIAIVMPMAALLFRFHPRQLALLHGLFVALSLAMMFVLPINPGMAWKLPIAVIVLNAAMLFVNASQTRVARRQLELDIAAEHIDAREQIRMRDELHSARDLQLSMLPSSAPQFDWLELAGISRPATEVGGDYYDFIPLDSGVAVICADVAGHGLGSGIVLASLRTGLAMVRELLVDPAAALERLDVAIRATGRRMLVTTAIVVAQREPPRITIANAGHPPLIVRRADGTIESVELFALPLGVNVAREIPRRSISFAPGDAFVLYTDGVTESRNAAGEEYGTDRLLTIIRSSDGSATAMRDAIVADVDRFRGDAAQSDDVTVVVARVTR
jgi:serine phosphatase RsbU (regulator of sigma subunit)